MLQVAVITGGHHYDVRGFQQLWRALPGIDAYPQHMADFTASVPAVRARYDVLVFYTHLRAEIPNLGLAPGRDDTFRSVLDVLGSAPQGLVVLHHALLAFPGWDVWDEVVGLPDRTLREYAHDERIEYRLAEPAHPICAGLADWSMVDETYLMPDAAADNRVLITTEHPRSMSTIAWTRQHKLSRVFCFQCGHDHYAWDHASFRAVLTQGIRWCAASSG